MAAAPPPLHPGGPCCWLLPSTGLPLTLRHLGGPAGVEELLAVKPLGLSAGLSFGALGRLSFSGWRVTDAGLPFAPCRPAVLLHAVVGAAASAPC